MVTRRYVHTSVDDFSACIAECEQAQAEGHEVSDGCARTIAALYAEGMGIGQAFASSGAISSPSDVWGDLFLTTYAGSPPNEQLLADMLGTYLISAGKRGKVHGWSAVWVRK